MPADTGTAWRHGLRLGLQCCRCCAGLTVILLVAVVTVHLPYGFSSIKLRAVTAAGPQFGPPGYETDLLYIAGLATLVLGGSGPLAADAWLPRVRRSERVKRQ